MHAGPAEAPLAIVLMIDDSGLGLQSIREGAAAFVTRLRDLAEIALITTGGRNIAGLDFTTDTNLLMAAINKTYARNATGAFLTDGILEAARVFGRIEQLASHVGIPIRMEATANELASQYAVTYETAQPQGVDLRLDGWLYCAGGAVAGWKKRCSRLPPDWM